MTEQEREELIEKMARHIAVSDDTTPDPNSEWCDQNWHCWIPEARAALAVAEPVIREQCAKIADATAKDYRVYRDHWPHAEGAEQVAAAIRQGGK